MTLMGVAQGRRSRNPAEVRAGNGAFALSAPTMSRGQAFMLTFGRSFSTLPVDAWPERGFACTAVDAETGGFQLWTEGVRRSAWSDGSLELQRAWRSIRR